MYKAFKVIKQMMKNHICFASFDEASAANGTCPRDQIADAICIAIGRWHCAADYAGSSPRADVTSENLLRVKNRQGKGYMALSHSYGKLSISWAGSGNIPGSSLAERVRAWTSLRDQTVNGNM